MPTSDITRALADLSNGTVTTGLDFLTEQVLARKKDWFDDVFINAVAPISVPEHLNLVRKLKCLGKDFSVREFDKRVAAAKARLESQVPRDGLLRSSNGSVLPGYDNASFYFQSDPAWRGVLGYNEFTGGTELLKNPPPPVKQKIGDEIEDGFDTDATRWLERRSLILFKRDTVRSVLDSIATENKFHPVRNYLKSLPEWDRKERISNWLFHYCGVDPGSDTKPNHFAASVGRKFLISMVARVMRPGCKADHMLVFEGRTGIGKSSVANALCPRSEWFTDQLGDLGSKDASMAVRGVWVVELGELDALSRPDEKTTKRFISQQFERFRLPYGRRVTKFERQCVFIGTTERSDWMKSETGRRFWPVLATKINFDAVAKDRDLLWSEALYAFNAGERWHLAGSEEVSEATEEQSKRYTEDIWRERVMFIVDEFMDDWIPMSRILERMQIPLDKWDWRTRERVGSILRMEGWERKQRRVNKKQEWGFVKAE